MGGRFISLLRDFVTHILALSPKLNAKKLLFFGVLAHSDARGATTACTLFVSVINLRRSILWPFNRNCCYMVEEKTTENKAKGAFLKVHCLGCNRVTRHLVKVSLDKEGTETNVHEGWSIDWSDSYQVVECQGCQTMSFRHLNWFSEAQGFDDDGYSERLYPQRNPDSVVARPFHNVPSNLRRIYKELVDCFNNDSPTLCAAGLRALVEGVCAQQGITDGPVECPAKGGGTKIERKKDLEGRIAGLQEKGLLTSTSAQTLHEHRYLGNDAVHELARPSEAELKLAIEIIEHVIEQLYELPEKAAELRREIARRKH